MVSRDSRGGHRENLRIVVDMEATSTRDALHCFTAMNYCPGREPLLTRM